MAAILSAELAATCSALGYFDPGANKYFADKDTLETVKDLIRYLRRDDENHDIRRQLGDTKVLQTDLLPMLKSYWEETELFDVLLRLLVNLTTPAVMLWNEVIPTEKIARNYYLQVVDHLKSYKEAFVDQEIWSVLSRRLSKILETDYAERGDENSLIIERILILLRNILYVPIDPYLDRPDDDASIHDQVLWALHQSGMLDIILYMSSSSSEQAYYMHILEILCFMLREQKASELAKAALQRSETEKLRDEAELITIRHKEAHEKQQRMKKYTGARHSRFGGTYVVKSMKSISENELIYHKPLNKLDELNFDVDKKKPKTPKNRLPVSGSTFERRSAFGIRLFLKEFCVEFLNGAYNTFISYIKNTLARGKAQDNDESYYFWAVRFFMEMNRCYKFDVRLVSETMSTATFPYIQREIEKHFDMMQTDRKQAKIISRRLHLALLAYRELLLTLCAMDVSPDGTVRDSSKVIKSNIFYIAEYRELILTLLITYDEIRSSDLYLKDLIETQHIFFKMLEKFCGKSGSVVVKKKSRTKKKKSKKSTPSQTPAQNLELLWDEVAPQLTAILDGGGDFTSDISPFDATSDIPIDDQKADAMKNIQRKLRNGEYEAAVGLLHASRDVWPTNDEFGHIDMSDEEEFSALKDIFFANIDDESAQQPSEDVEDEEDEEEYYDDEPEEREFKIDDFIKRLAHPKIVRACGLALRTFDKNSVSTNHCIIKLLHRIAFDCKMYVMLFQLSIFRTFQQIFKVKDLPQYEELVKFAIYVMRQFFKVAEKNKKIYMEVLFWKSNREAFEIEEGYGSSQNKSTARTWTEEDEDELRRLFIEHREKQIEEDVVDWICNNLIDNTRTRRSVLKKLKELMLITGQRPKSASSRAPSVWGQEEEEQLQELFTQFKDAMDPVGCIMERLPLRRPRNRIVEKLLILGLIQDKKEVRKKRQEKSRQGRQTQQNGNRKTNMKKKSKSSKEGSKTEIIKLILDLEPEHSDALEWLKESFSDAIEDVSDTGEMECSLPLVPIMDCSVKAVENINFQHLLKAMGIMEPEEGQEIYWRIPEMMSSTTLTEYVEILSQAIDKTLELPSEPTEGTTSIDSSQSHIERVDDIFASRNTHLGSIYSEDDDGSDSNDSLEEGGTHSQNMEVLNGPSSSTSVSGRKRIRETILTQENSSRKTSITKKKSKSSKKGSKTEIIKLILDLEPELSDALEWLKESFSDAIEDISDTGEIGLSLPLVPIMDYSVDAVTNINFQHLLKAMGIMEPEEGQEIYWRIPEMMSSTTLTEYVEILSQAIDKTLELPSEPLEGTTSIDSSQSHITERVEDIFARRNTHLGNIYSEDHDGSDLNDELEEEGTRSQNMEVLNGPSSSTSMSGRKRIRKTILIDSDSEEDNRHSDSEATAMQNGVTIDLNDSNSSQNSTANVFKKKVGRKSKLIDSDSENDHASDSEATFIQNSVNISLEEETLEAIEAICDTKKRSRRLIDSDESEGENSTSGEVNTADKQISDLQDSDGESGVHQKKKSRKIMNMIDSDEEV